MQKPFAVLVAILLRRLLDQHLHFLLRHLDAVRLADFGQQQAQPHAAFGDGAVIVLLRLDFLQRLFGIVFLARFGLKLRPDLVEFGIDHAGGTAKS